MELGVADRVPTFNAPALPDQSPQGFWGGAQAGEEQVPGAERFAITSAAGQQLNDPGTAWPIRFGVLRCLFGPQRPSNLAAMADLVMRFSKRDVALPLELGVD